MPVPLNIPTLEVNLTALRANYRLLKARHAPGHAQGGNIASVVKANAYGLGVASVSQALWAEGCRDFFVATLAEAIELRCLLPQARIGVFQGLLHGEEAEYAGHHLTPVLNDPGQLARFMASGLGLKAQGIVHVDTGMTRLGLNHLELEQSLPHLLSFKPSTLNLMSHLACANDRDDPKNAEQLARFHAARALLPDVACSFANSSGLFLSNAFHFDLARPGCALYGINPTNGTNPMRPVVTLSAPILQIRTLDRDETVGYGGTSRAAIGNRIAIAALGYADGIFRSLGNKGTATIGGRRTPFIGRVSMDMIALDVSQLPEALLSEDVRAEFIGDVQKVDDVAAACATIGYEVLTRIGNRVKASICGRFPVIGNRRRSNPAHPLILTRREAGLPRRFAPRNDGAVVYGCSPRNFCYKQLTT